MGDDFKRGTCDKVSKVGCGWYFNNGTTITIVEIEGDHHIVDFKNGETSMRQGFKFDELALFLNACKGLVAITDNNWETCVPILNIDNEKEN